MAPIRGAGQHRYGKLGNHGEINLDPVAFFDSVGFQDVGEFADFFMHLLVGKRPVFTGFIAFPLDGDLVRTGLQVFVQAVIGNIEFSTLEIL